MSNICEFQSKLYDNNRQTSYSNCDSVAITFCVFINCATTDKGGAISCNLTIDFDISSTHFENCQSTNAGGAINLEPVKNAIINRLCFYDCRSTGSNGQSASIWSTSASYSVSTQLISVALCPKSQNGRSDSYQQCGGTSLCIS
jgi:hypothetical protein